MAIETAAVALWFLGAAVTPDAWTRALNAIRGSRAEYRGLIKDVHQESGLPVGRAYKRWFKRDEVWQGLLSAKEDDVAVLTNILQQELERSNRWSFRKLSSDELKTRAEKLVSATFLTLIQNLNPSRAIAVTTGRLSSEIRSIKELLEAKADIDGTLRRFPPPARVILKELHEREPENVARLAELYEADSHPQVTFKNLVTSPPAWLADAGARVWLAIAQILRSHGEGEAAADSYRKVAELGWDRDRNLALAALHRAGVGKNDDVVVELLKEARQADGHHQGIVDLVEALIAEDVERIVSLAPDPLEVDSEFAGSMLNVIQVARGIGDALNVCKGLVVKYPEFSSFRVTMIRLTMANAAENGAAVSGKLRNELIASALEARDLRREWRGSSGECAQVACEIALSQADVKRVLEIGCLPPLGEATIEEAETPGVRSAVIEAALLGGQRELAESKISQVSDPFEKAVLGAEIASADGASEARVIELYSDAWSLCRNDSDRLTVWHRLAGLGADLPELDRLEEVGDVQATLILAQQEAAQGRSAEAIGRLRARKNRSPHIVELLVHLLLKEGEPDSAVSVLSTAAVHFGHPQFFAQAAITLARIGQIYEAEDFAVRALSVACGDLSMRVPMHEILIAATQQRQGWREMESRVRALMDEAGEEPQYRWLLTGALFNQREHRRAWEVLSAPPRLTPTDHTQALAWIDLNCSFRSEPELAMEIFSILDQFPDPDLLVGPGLVRYMMWAVRSTLPEEIAAQGRRRIEDFISAHPNHPSLYAMKIPEDATPEELIALLRPMLEPGSRDLLHLIQQVVDVRLPYGFLSAYVGKPYAMVFVLRAAGCLPINFDDDNIFDAECEAVRESLGGDIAVDTSVLGVFYYIRSLWANVPQEFGSISIPLPLKADIAVTARSSQLPSDGHIGWDPINDKLTVSDKDVEASERIKEKSQWMLDAVVDLEVRDWPTIHNFGEIFSGKDDDNRFVPTFAALDYAIENDVPFYADDSALRALARSMGVRTFGTTALLAVLRENGRINTEEYGEALDELRYQWCVDLPLDALSVSRAAERDNWAPGAGAFSFSRQAAWRDARAYKMWNLMAKRAYGASPDNLPGWLYYAAQGSTSGKESLQGLTIASTLLMSATVICGGSSEVFAKLLKATRDALNGRDIVDVLPSYVDAMRDMFEPAHGANMAARIILNVTERLAPQDRETVRLRVFSANE